MDRSSTSFPLISRQTVFEESDRSLFSKSSGGASRKKSLSISGLRIAHWARRILSATRLLSKMGSPKLILVGWASWTPFASVTMWSETRQRHGSFERDSWHSVGHLHIAVLVELQRDSSRNVALPRTGTARTRQSDAKNGLDEG